MMAAVIIDKMIEKVEDADSPKDAIADERSEHKLRGKGRRGGSFNTVWWDTVYGKLPEASLRS